MTDGGAVVAGDVVLVAEDDGDGLVVDALVGQEHRLALGAGCALAAVYEVDGAAVDLLGRASQHAVGVDLALGLAAAVAQLVVKVAHLFAGTQVIGIDGHLGGIAQQVAGKAGGAGAGTQDGVLNVDVRALVQEQAGVVERDPAVVERLRAGHVDGGVLVSAYAQHGARDALAGNGGVQGDLQVERCLRAGDDIDGGDGCRRVDAIHAHGGRGVLVCGHIDDDALGGVVGQVGIGGFTHAGLEGLGRGELLLELDGVGLVGGGGGHVELGLGRDAGAVGGVAGRGGAALGEALGHGLHGGVEGVGGAGELLVQPLDLDGLGRSDGKFARKLELGLVHLEPAPSGGRHRINLLERCSSGVRGLFHYPIAPSISSLIRLFISTAYSSGSSLETGLAKPLTIMVRASSSEMPRLIR